MVDFYPFGAPTHDTNKVIVKVRNGHVAIDADHLKLLRSGLVPSFNDLQLLSDSKLNSLIAVYNTTLKT